MLSSYFGDMTETSQRQKMVFRRGCESDTVERVMHVTPQAGSQSYRLVEKRSKTLQQNQSHCPRYDHELRDSNHALVSRIPVCARGVGV